MSPLQKKLQTHGIHAVGSPELSLLESRLNRFFSREYQRWMDEPVSLAECGVETTSGDMWEETGELIANHYDQSPLFFQAFLDKQYRAYSMAYFDADPNRALASKRSLELAQTAKFELICQRAGVRGGERILNIGCGFGSFEQYLLQRYPTTEMVSLTPSRMQLNFIQSRIDTPGDLFADGRLQLIGMDFNQLPPAVVGAESFDLVCSIGLLEQVKNMRSFLAKVNTLLRPGGASFHHFITSRCVIPRFLDAKDTLIRNYFPGGRIWPFDELPRHRERLFPEASWFINGMNYWRTLNEWHKRYWGNIEQLAGSLDEAQIRHWNDYFTLSKACFFPFQGRVFGNGQYLFRKTR